MSSNFRAVNLMETLQKSGDVVEKFENIIEECKNKKIKYVDPDFYPQKNIIDNDKTILEEHDWRRIEDQYHILFENISPEGVTQGKLGDCYFIASLIYTARNKNFVKSLFHPKSSLEYGVALVYFNFLGEKIPVIVDTQVPYYPQNTTSPLFSSPRTNEDSCWFVLVEKAFAKACGGYCFIESGQTHFGMRVLLDQFPVALSNIEDIIPESTIKAKKGKIDQKGEIFKEMIKLKKKNAMIGSDIKITNFPNMTKEDFKKATGLITEHAYQILDIREAEKKRFLKVQNPWGKFEWTGDYSDDSDKWTESLKKELGYMNEDDGTFWMVLEDFLKYFKSLDYSLPDEKGWKKQNVCGKIDGYLDGRSPCTNCKNIGCLPQWSIKFTKKTVVRLSYDVSGPVSYHGIYICKNHGEKVDSLGSSIEIMRNTTNTIVNGIEYEVKDFSEPYTFFLVRTDPVKGPCYYRILVESPDTKFTIKKFDDNFIKWNSVSHQGMFTSPANDQWNPFGGRSLQTCRQWSLTFPELKKNEKAELRIQLYKNETQGPLSIFIAKSDKKVSYAYSNLKYVNLVSYGVTDYEEYSVTLDPQPKEGESESDDSNQWTFCVYRGEEKDVTQFKFSIFCKSKFEFSMLPEPDPLKNCGYTITGKLQPGKKDGVSPYEKGVKDLRQWCLTFKKSPTVLFLDYSHKNAKSLHSVYLETRDSQGEKMDVFYKGTTHFDFDIPADNDSDRMMWKIEDISKFYALCVAREPAGATSEYSINIFGDNSFEMAEIADNKKLGKTAPKYKAKKEDKKDVKAIEFPAFKAIEQPVNFTPKKTAKPKPTQKPTQKHNQDQKSQGKSQKTSKNDQKPASNDTKPARPDTKPSKSEQKPANEDGKSSKGDQKPTKPDAKPSKNDQKPANEDRKSSKGEQKPTKPDTKPTKPSSEDRKSSRSEQRPADESRKSSRSSQRPTGDDRKSSKSEQKPQKEDQKPTKVEQNVAKNEEERPVEDENQTQSKCCLLI
ncbi:hypothetical protein M9Y10_006522 [Tritrichomonas musculus]|uniref:Calpain catalytic domain-containing protein n=1 Tax=Tritrichomonas musculus TaxID=1915356 RepID=A0ABR2JEK8_9EUKA